MSTSKEEIRRCISRQRLALQIDVARMLGDAARRNLLGMRAYLSAACISCYVSVKNEIDTLGLIAQALEAGKRVGAPVAGARRQLVHRELCSLDALEPAAFGLLEPPESSHEIPPESFDLVVVPGLAFDRHGYRVGFGAGYYDRFLAETSAIRVGLCYAFQVVDSVPSEAHDQPVDFVATDREVHMCRGGVDYGSAR